VKSFDHTANHYFGMAALTALGLQGIKEKLTLPPPFNDDVGLLSEEERKLQGISRLPLTFEERCAAINSD
jgi:glutamine synthetase